MAARNAASVSLIFLNLNLWPIDLAHLTPQVLDII